jgi:hypothetical protein
VTEPNTNWAVPEGTPSTQPPSQAPAPSQTPSPAPAPVVAPKKKSSGLVNAVLVVGALIAVGGIAFAVGRTTAPAQASGFRGQGVSQGGTQAFPGMPGGSFDPGQGGPGGVPGGGDRTMTISGTVKSLDGTTMVITTASGSETTIDVSGATYHSQAAASASDVTVGSKVSVATEGFGFRRPDASAAPDASGAPVAGSGSITATDVMITSGQ